MGTYGKLPKALGLALLLLLGLELQATAQPVKPAQPPGPSAPAATSPSTAPPAAASAP